MLIYCLIDYSFFEMVASVIPILPPIDFKKARAKALELQKKTSKPVIDLTTEPTSKPTAKSNAKPIAQGDNAELTIDVKVWFSRQFWELYGETSSRRIECFKQTIKVWTGKVDSSAITVPLPSLVDSGFECLQSSYPGAFDKSFCGVHSDIGAYPESVRHVFSFKGLRANCEEALRALDVWKASLEQQGLLDYMIQSYRKTPRS